jgi:NADH-quinone oxidoreductase subunit E
MSAVPAAGLREAVRAIVARYPSRGAALLPVLHLLQVGSGAITPAEEALAAEELGVAPIRIREAVTFYEMLRTRPAGRHVIRLCVNLSCTMAGAEDVLSRFQERLGIGPGETTADGRFTLVTAQCLGNCDKAPCLQVDGEDRGPVGPEAVDGLLASLESRGPGEKP